jgi:hypothetical protein
MSPIERTAPIELTNYRFCSFKPGTIKARRTRDSYPDCK